MQFVTCAWPIRNVGGLLRVVPLKAHHTSMNLLGGSTGSLLLCWGLSVTISAETPEVATAPGCHSTRRRGHGFSMGKSCEEVGSAKEVKA